VWLVTSVWRLRGHRTAVLAVAVLSVLVAVLLAYRVSLLPPGIASRSHDVSIARVLVYVDTPKSRVVDLGGAPGGEITSLTSRAHLLGSLILNPPLTDDIARRARIAPETLVVVPPKRYGPASRLPSEVTGAAIGREDPRAHVLTTRVPLLAEGETPVIEFKAQASDPGAAVALARAAVAVLGDHVDSVGSAEGVPSARQSTIRELSAPVVETRTEGSRGVLPALAAIFLFALGCVVILGVTRLGPAVGGVPLKA
jgi:hypothetical protein